jgi:hypothetical protein
MPRVTLVVSPWLKTDDVAAFEAFERAVVESIPQITVQVSRSP